MIASKHRNLETGKIDFTDVPISVNDADKDFFIFDDICDGGRTFIEIAKTIERKRSLSSSVHPKNYGKNYLVITHGIFSSGFEELNKHFNQIYCTNSVIDMWDNDFISANDNQLHKLSQFNVF